VKTLGAPLTAHLLQTVTTLAECWLVTRADGTKLGFTTHDRDLVIGGVTYEAASGHYQSAVASTSGLSTDDVDILCLLESGRITEADLMAGLYDGAALDIFLVNWADLTIGVLYQMRGARTGEIVATQKHFTGTVESKTRRLEQNILRTYTPDCDADLGDTRCKIVLDPTAWAGGTVYAVGAVVKGSIYDARRYVCTTGGTSGAGEPVWDTVIGHTTADGGTLVWTTFEAWTKRGTVTTLTSRRVFQDAGRTEADGWFTYGKLTWLTGANVSYQMEIKSYSQATGEFELFDAMPYAIAAGDTYSVHAGCDKNNGTCKTTFGNILNFRGSPFIPGIGKMLEYPGTVS